MLVQLTKKSGNVKTGPIPVSTTEAKSCPSACPWEDKGCYAKYGPLGMHWAKLADRGETWAKFVKAIAALPAGQLWRHNQAGDLPGCGNRIDQRKLSALVKANKGKRGYTYTHKPVNVASNAEAIREANEQGFVVNLSGDSLAHADELAALEIGPVVTVLPRDVTKNTKTPAGRKVVVCPAAVKDNVSCATCKLCAIADRKTIVGFPAHGSAAKHVSQEVSK